MKAICEIVKIDFDIVATSDLGCRTDLGAVCEGCDTD